MKLLTFDDNGRLNAIHCRCWVGGRESDENVTSVTFVPAARITGTGWARVSKLQPAPVPVSARSLDPYGFINP